jgi:hypothetical protein
MAMLSKVGRDKGEEYDDEWKETPLQRVMNIEEERAIRKRTDQGGWESLEKCKVHTIHEWMTITVCIGFSFLFLPSFFLFVGHRQLVYIFFGFPATFCTSISYVLTLSPTYVQPSKQILRFLHCVLPVTDSDLYHYTTMHIAHIATHAHGVHLAIFRRRYITV